MRQKIWWAFSSRIHGLAALLLLFTLAAPACAQDNIVKNPSFADGIGPWWGQQTPILRKFENIPAIAIAGDFIAQDKIPAKGGQRYRLTVKIACQDAPTNSVFIQMSARGPGVNPGWRGEVPVATQGHMEAAVIVTGGTHGWKTFTTVITAPADADQLLLYLRKERATAGTAYYSGVELVPTDDAAAHPNDALRQQILDSKFLTKGEAGTAQSAAPSASRDHDIIANAKLAVAVHVGRSEDYITLSSAVALADTLAKMTGETAPALSSDERRSSRPLLIVGNQNALARTHVSKADLEGLGDDGFLLRSVGPNVIITGRTPRGTMYGVNWLLDHKFDVRWLSPTVTDIPKSTAVRLSPLNETHRPRFAFREILIAEAQDKAWRQHNLLNGESHGPAYQPTPPEINSWNRSWQIPGSGDPFFALLPPDKFGAAHPDWYAGGQLAMMNKGMRAAMAAAVVDRLRQLPDYRDVWYAINDQDWGWDMDPQSRDFADKHGGFASAPRLDMMIDVAQQVRAILPGARLAFNAYHWSFAPPTGMTVPDFLLVYPMTIQVDYSHPLSDQANASIRDGLTGWNAISKNILVWDHITNFSGFIQPTPNIFPIAKSIQWLGGLNHVQGYFAEGSWDTPGSEFSALRAWLFARLLWDPNQDVNALIADFCDRYYGPASKAIQAYITLYHSKIASTGDRLPEKTQVDLKMFDPSFMVAANSLFDQAEKETTGTPFASRVREARIGLDYVTLIRRAEYQSVAPQLGIATATAVKAKTDRLLAAIKEAKVTQFYQGGPIPALVERLNIMRKAPTAPLFDGKAPAQWHDVQDLSFNLYDNAHIVADAGASDGAAVMLDGRNPGWNVQLKLDKLPAKGQWWVYASMRIETDGTVANLAHVGSAPPMSCFTAVSGSPAEPGYRWVEVPGGSHAYSADHEKSLYVAAVPGSGKRQIFIDRFVATDRPMKFPGSTQLPAASGCSQ